jgi:hypothetical protein
MPRPLGILLITAAVLLFGVYTWFAVVWLLSAGAKLTDIRVLNMAMFILAPHTAGWLVALAFSVIATGLGLWFARKRRLSWLGFAAHQTSNPPPEDGPSDPLR